MPEQINPLKKFINSAIIAANTDLQTGDVRKPFTNKPIYELSSASEKMGSQELGFGKELLENNKQRFFNRIKEMATEKGTWTKENIKRAEAIKFALYNLPIIHYTTESRCKLPKNDDRDGTYWLENIDQEGLLSAEKVVEIGGIHLNTYIEDIEIDRHKYVYACLGELYFAGAPQRDMCAMILNKSLLKLPSTLIQDQKFQKQLGLGNLTITSFSNKNEMYQDFNESSLTATDYITLMSLGISTGTIDYNSTFPEVMLRDNVPSNKIDCILQPTEQDEITDEECVIFTSKMDTISNNSGKPKYGVYDKTVSVPQEIFYKLHEKSTLAPDTSFKSKPQPWYKKAVAAISK